MDVITSLVISCAGPLHSLTDVDDEAVFTVVMVTDDSSR